MNQQSDGSRINKVPVLRVNEMWLFNDRPHPYTTQQIPHEDRPISIIGLCQPLRIK
eukprot:c35182_g1_i1 orf=1-165(-)